MNAPPRKIRDELTSVFNEEAHRILTKNGRGTRALDSFARSKESFRNTMHTLGIRTASEMDRYAQDALTAAETELTDECPVDGTETMPDLLRSAELCLAPYHDDKNDGRFLKESVAADMLAALPPTELLRYATVGAARGSGMRFAPRQALALTRHTESTAWNGAYARLLSQCRPHDFEYRAIEPLVLDADEIMPAFTTHGHHIKPWLLSHSKETGIIIFFSRPKRLAPIPTPRLLRLAVALHYVHEIRFASRFFERIAQGDPETFGRRVANLVLGHRQPLSFLTDKNAYDETLYWDLALDDLFASRSGHAWRQLDLPRSAGGTIDGSPRSLHPVDLIWNACIPTSSGPHLYHYKQSLWTEMVYAESLCTRERLTDLLMRRLDASDEALTEALLESAATQTNAAD